MDKSDTLWKTIQRFDQYVSSSQSKSAAILTLDGFLGGAISLKASEIAILVGTEKWVQAIALVTILIMTIGTCMSLVYAIRSLTPNRKSPPDSDGYTSLVFFMDIASKNDADSFLKQFDGASEKDLIFDLGKQVHSMAMVVKEKYDDLEKAVWWLLWFQIVPLGVLICLKLIVAISRVLLA